MLVVQNKNYPSTPSVKISLQNGMFVLCSPKWLKVLKRFHWYAKKSAGLYYACSKVTHYGRVSFIRMHRFVANTPREMVCHHLNGNSLDNRVDNLLNMTWYEHAKLFSYR